MKKLVLKSDLHDERDKQKAMKAVSSISGVESIAMDMKEKKLTVIGDVDPVYVVGKLRKKWYTEILTVGLVEEPEKKKDECKKDEDERKKNEEKKDEGKKDEDKKKEEEKQIAELVKACKAYNPWMTQYYYVQSAEENPNACVVY